MTDQPEEAASQDGGASGGSVTLGGIGWTLLLGGAATGLVGATQDIPSLLLLAVGGVAMQAGFFCILFAWIGAKIDGLKKP